MAKHTPGPWRANGSVVSTRIFPSELYVAEVSTAAPARGGNYRIDEHRAELLANARLIAAAPELLAVVKELRDSAQYWSEYDVPLGIVDRIDAAIEMAEPESACALTAALNPEAHDA